MKWSKKRSNIWVTMEGSKGRISTKTIGITQISLREVLTWIIPKIKSIFHNKLKKKVTNLGHLSIFNKGNFKTINEDSK